MIFGARTRLRAIMDLQTGHNTLRGQMHVMRFVEDPVCRIYEGGGEESSLLLLCHYDALVRQI